MLSAPIKYLLIGLKIVPEPPGHLWIMVSNFLLPACLFFPVLSFFLSFFLEIPVFLLYPQRNLTSFMQLSDPISRSVMKDISCFMIKLSQAVPEKSNLREIRIRSQFSYNKCRQNVQYHIKPETYLLLSPGKYWITPWKLYLYNCLGPNSNTNVPWA